VGNFAYAAVITVNTMIEDSSALCASRWRNGFISENMDILGNRVLATVTVS